MHNQIVIQPQTFGSTLLIGNVDGGNNKQSILLVALNRQKVKNAFNDEQYLDLISVLTKVETDETLHAIVLTGMGNYFSSGADLSSTNFGEDDSNEDEEEEVAGKEQPSRKKGMIDRPAGQFMMKLLSFPKLICCAVNGPAVGIGVTLLPHCDLVYCTKYSTFWTPFTRIALTPEFSSSVTFVETMGLACANEMLILGEKINAQKAVSNHLCIKIVEECSHECTDAFAPDSIGRMVCQILVDKLFSLPSSEATARIFVEMIRGRVSRQQYLENICKEELSRLDERVENGEVLEAVLELSVVRSKL
jgi:peroxisomal 3,2-trans-enoyl-CoA isomerase